MKICICEVTLCVWICDTANVSSNDSLLPAEGAIALSQSSSTLALLIHIVLVL